MLCLVLLFISLQDSKAQTLEPGQIYTTPNVVQVTQQGGPSTWVNGVYQNSLTCWTGGDPGYCGPNAIVRPGNNINFSYGQTDLHQVQAIAGLLPQVTGLQVNGYNFRFTAKNGNGWDDGRVDQLSAYVYLYNNKGAIVENNQYNLTYKFDWTNFNFNKDFTTPYQLGNLSTVRYGFVGGDNNFWAGPYGPEITNVSFQLKYSVDPCTTNPLYSANCSGYLAALNNLVPQQTQSTTTTAIQTIQEPIAPVAPATVASVSQTTQQVAAVVAQTLQPQTQQQQSQQSGNTQLGLSVIARNQDRERQIQASAVQQALDIAQQATLRTEQQAISTVQQQVEQTQQSLLANTVVMHSATSQIAAITQQAQRQTDSLNVRTVQDPSQQQNVVQQVQNASVAPAQQLQVPQQLVQQTVLATTIQQQQPVQVSKFQQESLVQAVVSALPQPVQQEVTLQPQAQQSVVRSQVADSTPQTTVQEQQPAQQQAPARSVEPETQPSTTLALLDRTNPLSEFLNPQVNVSTQSTTSVTQDVRREQQNNELAGGINLDRMATQPVGYQQYLGLALLDAKFYATREIYGKQTTVDNQRALRQLSSDRLHQQMVNQQYR